MSFGFRGDFTVNVKSYRRYWNTFCSANNNVTTQRNDVLFRYFFFAARVLFFRGQYYYYLAIRKRETRAQHSAYRCTRYELWWHAGRICIIIIIIGYTRGFLGQRYYLKRAAKVFFFPRTYIHDITMGEYLRVLRLFLFYLFSRRTWEKKITPMQLYSYMYNIV